MSMFDRRTEYEASGLERGDLDPDPIAQWQRWYADAVRAGLTEPDAVALATVDTDGHTDCRFVLARRVDERGFAFFTNYTSRKADQLAAVPWASFVAGWLDLHRQVRARGPVEPLTVAENDDYFRSRPRGSQLGAWASAQSSVIASRAELEDRYAELDRRYPREVPRPDYWGGYRLVPDEVEFWQGRPNRLHDRFRYRREGATWEIDRLSP
jgi:pyridoxamine 5'-phosphate oxidase